MVNRRDYGMDFMVGGSRGSSSSSANLMLFASKDGSWNKIVISYIITSRSDFFLGSFTVSSFQFTSSGLNQYTYRHSLPFWSSSSSNFVYQQAHLSGLRTTATQISSIKLDHVQIDRNSGQIVVKFTVNTNQII